MKRAVSLPSSVISSSRTILIDLLGGRERGKHFGADGLLADVLDQVGDDVEVDVGFEHGDANLAQSLGDVFFSERALATKILEDTLEFVGKILKHRVNLSLPDRLRWGGLLATCGAGSCRRRTRCTAPAVRQTALRAICR